MKKLGVVANCSKPRAPEVLAKLCERAGTHGITLYADDATAAHLKMCHRMSREQMFAEVDVIMALGGDGTMLSVVRDLAGLDRPVIGLNIGGLGFLTSVAEGELDRALEALVADRCDVSTRAILEATVERGGQVVCAMRALNEVVVNSVSARIVCLEVSVDKERVASYRCDGLIVATPTGSTGHSLSAGGPILHPALPAFLLNVICPHTLNSRPLVVPDRSHIAVELLEGNVLLSSDGQVSRSLDCGDVVRIVRAQRSVRFLHLPEQNYYSVLRQKLFWNTTLLARAE